MKTPYILTLASFLLLLTSCRESFLEQIPESYLTDVNFFKTEDDFRQALNGAYDGMRKAMAGRSSWIMEKCGQIIRITMSIFWEPLSITPRQ
jgi:hypothetical protein